MSELQHAGVKGMRWGVRRNRNRPGGADGKEESTKVVDKRNGIQKRLDSMKRERQWGNVLKEIHKMNTKDITAVTKRVTLENNLKNLSKSKVATKKDKEDYLRREHMSDAELSRKVTRLRAKEGLHKAVKDASKEQREFGEKVVKIGSNVGVKYVTNKMAGRKTTHDDLFEAVFVTKKGNDTLTKVADKVLDKTTLSNDNRKKAQEILEKAYESKTKKSKS